jgi:CTP:molybdopterin cytidylyltransferase MocA
MGRPKALVEAPGGGTFLSRVVEACRAGGCVDVIVVVGGDGEAVEAEARRLGALAVVNGRWHRGRGTSIKAGLPHLPRGAAGLLLHPVDHPLVAGATTAALLRAFQDASADAPPMVVPVHGGRRGHPVLLGASLFPRLALMGDDEPLRDLLRAAGVAALEVEVPDAAIHRNLDAPEDLIR